MKKNDDKRSGRDKTATKPKTRENDIRVLLELEALRGRLKMEGELELLSQIKICQTPLKLKCASCHAKKVVSQRCKRRWCPCCAKQIASKRAREMDFIVEHMRWPLFVTLTMKHSSTVSPSDVRTLVKSFGKLRHRKVWRSNTRGGVSCVELTNDEGGWHPHLHCVIDCRWLAVKTPEPRRGSTPEKWREACVAAATELGEIWAKILKQPLASVRIKRANKRTIAKEVTKYTVKNEDLVMCQGNPGDIIRALDLTRAMRTFGTAHGQCVKDIRKMARAASDAQLAEWREVMSDYDCCPAIDLLPEGMADNPRVVDRIQILRRVGEDDRALDHARGLRCDLAKQPVSI